MTLCCRNADHVHTNFKDLYMHLRQKGYYVEVLGKSKGILHQYFVCLIQKQKLKQLHLFLIIFVSDNNLESPLNR